MIRDILVQGKKTQQQLGQYRYVNKYLNAILRRETSLIDAMMLDKPTVATAAPNATNGVFEGLTFESVAAATNVLTARPTQGADSRECYPAKTPEPAYLLPSAAATAQFLQWRLPLGIIKNSFLALDKTLYFPEALYIKITWDTAASAYYTQVLNGSTPTDPTANTPATAITAYTLNNFGLQLCQEENIAIQNKLREEV